MCADNQDEVPVNTAMPDVLKHLADSLAAQRRRYRKRVRRCQQRFSAESVHDVRVESRRLLAALALLRAFLPERDLKKARRTLKQHLDTFDQLRDTQVQLAYVQQMPRSFPMADKFRAWLSDREQRFTREARHSFKRVKTKRLSRRVAALEENIEDLRRHTSRLRAFQIATGAVDRAFDSVARASRRVRPGNSTTIHRTRVAFKRFRYMVEALSPLLPGVTGEHRRAMHGYQSMMGDIQDVEILLGAFEEFIRSEDVDGRSARKLRMELRRRRQWLIQVYMNASGKLRQFWPIAGIVSPAGSGGASPCPPACHRART